MKQFGIRATALTLAVLVGLTPLASASVAMGDELHSGTVKLAPGSELERQVFWSNSKADLRTERTLTYTPDQGIYPMVVYGNTLLGKQSLSDMAKSLEAQGHRVVGGVNGDFFDMSTGNALGVLISDGVLRTTDGSHYAVAFREDGTAFIGWPGLSVTASFSGSTMRVTDVNKTRTGADGKHEGGLYLYTDEYSRTTQHTSPGYDIILTPIVGQAGGTVDVDLDVTDPDGTDAEGPDAPSQDMDASAAESGEVDEGDDDQAPAETTPASGVTPRTDNLISTSLDLTEQLQVGGRLSCTVDQVLKSTGSIDIPAGKLVLTANEQNNEWLLDMIHGIKVGDQVDIDVTTTDTRWNDVETAIGGYYKIVTNGQVGPQTDNTANPRTAIGIKADGSVVFYAIDGSQSGYSIGATLSQVAQRLIELGCVEAVGLDGGGSTTMVGTMPGNSTTEILNRPSGGSQRSVTNGIFLVSDLKPSGVLGHYYVTPYDSLLLAGAQVSLQATAMDNNGFALSDSGTVSWSVRDGDGMVDVSGTFTAGIEGGTTQVTASSGSAEGSASIAVVKTPDAISIANETTGAPVTTLALDPLQSVDLKASAIYRKLALTSQDSCYVWTAEPAIGTVDENGVLTASDKTGGGNLVVSAGGKTITIPVTVAGHIWELNSFETEAALSAFTSTTSAAVNLETASDLVRYGQRSIRVDYNAATGTATMDSTQAIPTGERYLSLWVYGDGSANALTATVGDSAGATSDIVLTALDFTGWKQLTVALPENASSIRALNVIYSGGEKSIGTLYFDQLTTSNEARTDQTPPTVTTKVEGSTLTAYVSDNVDKSFANAAISLTWDGAPMSFTWKESTGTLTATLPGDDGRLHRATVTATDQSGNIARSSQDILPRALTGAVGDDVVPADPGPFVDMSAHWAAIYTTYLANMGVVKGVDSDTGYLFQPEKNITRGEFALMVGRWMGLDFTQYANVKLPFTDISSIPTWALDGMKAMYAEGIIKGSMEGGNLVGRANASISRAEAMTILGRIQDQGHARPALAFADAGSVASWALPYVQSLVGQNIISGYDNQLRPNDPVKRCEVAKMLSCMF